jgi:hypothetical protein
MSVGMVASCRMMSYRLLVLPGESMTPKLLRKIKELVEAGASVIGPRPLKSPSLSDYPRCDQEVRELADELWGHEVSSARLVERTCGKGRVFSEGGAGVRKESSQDTKSLLGKAKWIWQGGDPRSPRRWGRSAAERSRSSGPNIEPAWLAATNFFVAI